MMVGTVLCKSSSRNIAFPATTNNIIPLRQKILPRHKDYLLQWLEAGLSMGLLDAAVECPSPHTEQITVWVRENAEPAYIVTPAGRNWVLTDHLHHYELGRYSSLDKALNKIRPVLPLIH